MRIILLPDAIANRYHSCRQNGSVSENEHVRGQAAAVLSPRRWVGCRSGVGAVGRFGAGGAAAVVGADRRAASDDARQQWRFVRLHQSARAQQFFAWKYVGAAAVP